MEVRYFTQVWPFNVKAMAKQGWLPWLPIVMDAMELFWDVERDRLHCSRTLPPAAVTLVLLLLFDPPH